MSTNAGMTGRQTEGHYQCLEPSSCGTGCGMKNTTKKTYYYTHHKDGQ